jgi:hypothetical protein
MPRITEFYGIFIYMYFQDNKQYNAPHIHVRYAEYKASFSIETGDLLAGRLPNKQTKRVKKWIGAGRQDLEENWERSVRGEALKTINPL